MADREQPFGEGNGRNSCNLSPLHIDLKSKKGRIVTNPMSGYAKSCRMRSRGICTPLAVVLL